MASRKGRGLVVWKEVELEQGCQRCPRTGDYLLVGS